MLSNINFMESMTTYFRGERHLLLIDGLHDGTSLTAEEHKRLSATEKSRLRSLIHNLKGGKSLILIVSRHEDFFQDLPTYQRYRLQGLEYRQAIALSSSLIY